MADSSKSDAQVAFIAAAIVLLALPLLVAIGAAALGLVLRFSVGDALAGEITWIAWAMFAAWVVLVVAVVLAFTVRFVRRRSA
jgi:hypothetical protein